MRAASQAGAEARPPASGCRFLRPRTDLFEPARVAFPCVMQSFVFLFQFLDSLEGRAGVCTCHSKLRYPKIAEMSSE